MLVSCSTKDDAGDVIANKFEQIKILLPQGKWKISNIYTNNSEHTTDFESFIFTFNEDGTVNGETDLYAEEGTWIYKSSPESGEQLILEFNGTTPFQEISNNWDIVSVSNTKIELSDVGISNDDTQLLAFSKI